MVLIHLKKNDQSVLLADIPAATPVDTATAALVHLWNGRLRVERLCTAMEDLAKYGVYKPYDQHGYQPEDLDKFAHEEEEPAQPGFSSAAAAAASGGNGGALEVVVHEGREYLKKPDPTGRRTGFAPLQSYADTINKTCADAMQAIHKSQVAARVVLTRAKLDELVSLLRAAVAMAYPMGLPEFDPVQEILDETEDLSVSIHAKDVLDPSSATLWWAGKQLERTPASKLLSDYVGRNDKTTIIAKLAKAGSGAPSREPPLDEKAQKDMMAYYYRKQEELKKLEDDDDDSYLQAKWADPRALKSSFQGLGASGGGVSWRPR